MLHSFSVPEECHVYTGSTQLEGSISTSAADHAKVAVPGLATFPLFTRTVTLFSVSDPQDARCIAVDTQYRFSIPFPTYIDGQSEELPPSHSAIHPGVASEIRYSLQVDVMRKGLFRRNEV